MITSNVIQRVFLLIFQSSMGTMFTIDIDNRQYIITAKHLVKNIKKEDTLFTAHNEKIKTLKVRLVGHCEGEKDISVLSPSIQLSPPLPLPATMGNIYYGQDVYFLGFPELDRSSFFKINRGFPLPFVKRAIVSNMRSNRAILFLDGHNNPGFSGGPVVFKTPGNQDLKVAGVISGYRVREDSIYRKNGIKDKKSDALVYKTNIGIILSYGINCAVDLIKKNPIGYKIKPYKVKK